MPRKLTSQEFNNLVQSLERMADGIAKHKNTDGFPSRLSDENRRAMKAKLEELRGTYESFTAEKDRAYDVYSEYFELCVAELAKDHDTLRGHYGKDSTMLVDYGTRSFAKPPGRPNTAKKKTP